jgi:membrane dipeptidase
MLDLLTTIERDSAGSVRITRTVQEIEACLAAGVHSATIHFEGAEAIHADLSNLADYHDRGLRSLGITWSRPNAFGHGVPFQFPGSPDTGPGLTDAGKALVPACGQLKILLDVSHLNQQGFFDVMNLAAGPVVASHSNAHALCPSPRNLTDDQLGAIAATGGLVGITPAVLFLRDDGRNEADTPLSRVVDHVRYVADLIGIEHVGLGSDFDGARVPAELGDASGLTRLIEALRDGGLSDSDIDAIAHQNWLRVLRQTWGR